MNQINKYGNLINTLAFKINFKIVLKENPSLLFYQYEDFEIYSE